MSRADELAWLRDVARDSIEAADPEKRAPLIAQMRAIVAELDDLGSSGVGERNGLIDFQQVLAKRRQSVAAGAGGGSRQ